MRKPQLAAAEANLALANAELQKAERNLERTYIRLPFDGRIRSVNANIGQYVGAGTQLGEAFDSTTMEVRVPLSEQQAALIDLPFASAPNQAANVKLTGVVAGKSASWMGKLTRTDAFVHERSRMYYAIVEVDAPFKNANTPLLPGLFVEAHIEGKPLHNIATLPREALYQKDILVTLDADNQATHKTIRVLNKTEDKVWVSGVEKGEKVLLGKQALVANGDKVESVLSKAEQASDVALTTAKQ